MIPVDQSDAYIELITPTRVRLLGATAIEEQAFCEWYAANYFRGVGCIVELGPWLGSITVSTAVGLLRNLPANTPSIYVYDLFRWERGSSLWARETPFENIYREGDDFLPLYNEIIAPFKSHIDVNVHAADLSHETWDSHPIECLINDAWKTVPVMVNTICQFFPSLIPGATLLHQDYLWCTDSFIHIGMYRLRDYFDIVHRVHNSQMVVFRLNKAIPSNISEYFADLESIEDFEVEEIEAAFEWSVSLFGDNHPDAVLVVRAAKAWMLYKVGYIEEARLLFLQNRKSPDYNHPFYLHQEDTLRSWGLGKVLQ